jgi:hypothetical protein
MKMPFGACALALILSLALSLNTAHAAPFTPTQDSEIVERLPFASDPAARQLDSLRQQLAGRPADTALRLDIAQRYFALAMAQGDPRLVGYATAALEPLAKSAPSNADYWLLRGQLQQFNHQFDDALASLAKASQLDSASPAPLAWRAAIFMVQARYAEAEAECQRLKPLAELLWGAGCLAYAQSASGSLRPAFDALSAAVRTAATAKPPSTPELLLWSHTRLAEMALRLRLPELAETHFKSALALGVTDQFLLGAYADFLLQQRRPAEVLALLAGWERSDILLLRLALAANSAKDARAADWTRQLRERFDAAAQRGDSLHEQEAARFELDLRNNPARALTLAGSNYAVQKEPRDAEILMRAALAAQQPRAAQPAIDWLRISQYEDAALEQLARQLIAQGASR